MIEDTFIKLNRGITGWEWYQDANTFRLFVHCLLKANWKDLKFKGEVVKRGSFVTSLEQLSKELGISIQQVKTALKHLIKSECLTSKSTNKYRIIKVLNYDSYQTANKQTNSQLTINQQTTNKQVTTSKELKELKELKEYPNMLISDEELLPEEAALLEELNWLDNVNLFDTLEEIFGRPITQPEAMRLADWQKEYTKEHIYNAIRESDLYEKRSFDYIDRILASWKKEGKEFKEE